MTNVRGGSISGCKASALGGAVTAILAAGLCWAATACAAGATPESSLTSPTAVLPPDLVALEQKAEALHVNSVSFTVLTEVPAEVGSLVLSFRGSGVASVSPEEASMESEMLGVTNKTRVVGHAIYTYSFVAAAHDKGRPWVRRHHAAGLGVDPLSLDGAVFSTSGVGSGIEAGTAAGGSFAGIARAFAEASSVTEVGPEIVNGSQATEFSATLSPSEFLAGLSQEFPKVKRKLGKLSARLYVSFAPDGLPVRTSWTVGDRAMRITSTIDITATEVPVSVKAPPADKTIGAARLKKLLARQWRRERARMRREKACMKRLRHKHPSPKQTRKCRRGTGVHVRTSHHAGKSKQ